MQALSLRLMFSLSLHPVGSRCLHGRRFPRCLYTPAAPGGPLSSQAPAAARRIAEAQPCKGGPQEEASAAWAPEGAPCCSRTPQMLRGPRRWNSCTPRGPRMYHKDCGGAGAPTEHAVQPTQESTRGDLTLQGSGQGAAPSKYTEGPLTLEDSRELRLRAQTHKRLQLPGGIVDRYLPPQDPSALLLEPHKLTREEQRFQILFAVLPWICFGCMLASPLALAQYHVNKLRERQLNAAAVSRQLREHLQPPSLLVLSFDRIKQLVEQPYEALLLMTDFTRFGALTTACLFADLAKLLRKHGIELPIAICDLHASLKGDTRPGVSGGRVSKQEAEFSAAASPHVFLLLPEGLAGEPAAQVLPELQDEKMFEALASENAAQIALVYIESIRPSAASLKHEVQAIDLAASDLFRCEFAEAFVDAAAHAGGKGGAEQQQQQQQAASDWRVEGVQAALAACRQRRRQKYPSVLV